MYRRFLEAWKDADEPFRDRVKAARKRLEELVEKLAAGDIEYVAIHATETEEATMSRKRALDAAEIGTEVNRGGGIGRRVMARGATLLLAAALAVGCRAPEERAELGAEHEAALEDTLVSLTERVDAAWKELEAGPYLAHYSDDVHFYYQGSHLDRAAFEQVVREEMSALEEFSTEIVEPRAEVLGPDAGVVSFRYRGTAVDTAGESTDLTAAVTVVFERRDGEWTIVQAHESFPSDVEF